MKISKLRGCVIFDNYIFFHSVILAFYTIVYDTKQLMGTRIGYRIEARARMKGRYGTEWHLTSLIKTIGGEFSYRQRNPNHNYAYTRLQQILSQDSSRTSVHFVPCTGLWRKRARNFKSYDYLTLFQYPWLTLSRS